MMWNQLCILLIGWSHIDPYFQKLSSHLHHNLRVVGL
jgi:hypothetical protein